MGLVWVICGSGAGNRPTLAGVLVDSFGWRMIFYVDAAIMAVSFVFALIVFQNVLETKHQKFDVSSFGMSAAAFGGVTLGIGNLSGQGITNMVNWIILAVGVIVFVVFVKRQLHLEEPFWKCGL